MFPCLGAGMVLNEEKKARLVEVIACRQTTLDGIGGSAFVAPLAAVPVVAVEASPTPTPC